MIITKLMDAAQMPNPSQDQATFDERWLRLLTDLPDWGSQVNAIAALLNAVSTGGAYAIPYVFDTATADASPGADKLRLSTTTQNAATTMRLGLTAGGQNYTSVIDTFDASTSTVKGTIRLVKVGDLTKWMMFDVTARATPTGYRNLTVVCTGSSSASPFLKDDGVMLLFQRNGDKGEMPTFLTVIVRDEKPSGTSGGAPAGQNVWVDRILNTVVVNTAGASLSGNAITLPAGKWEYEGSAPCFAANANQARLFNATDSTSISVGTSEYSHVNYPNTTRSVLRGEFTLAAPKAIKVQHFVASASSSGWGNAASSGAVEVYTEIKFRKVL